MRLRELLKKKQKLQEELKEIELQILERNREAFIVCPYCGEKDRRKNIELTIGLWYVPPFGCTEGDYMKESGDYYLKCNHCDIYIRFYKSDAKEKIGSFDWYKSSISKDTKEISRWVNVD